MTRSIVGACGRRWRLEVPGPRAQQVCDAPPSVLATVVSRCFFTVSSGAPSCSAGGIALYCETSWLPSLCCTRERSSSDALNVNFSAGAER